MKLNWRTVKSYLRDEVVEVSDSPHNGRLEVGYAYGKLMLNTENVNYSYGLLDKVMRTAIYRLKVERRAVHDVLLLGLGAGNLAAILGEHKRPYRMVGVEIDPEVVRLGRRHFGLDAYPSLEVVVADAVDYIRQCTDRYDLIIVDLFRDAYVPRTAETDQFMLGLARCLHREGLLMWNRLMLDAELRQQTESFTRKMQGILPGTSYISAAGNRMLYYERK
ncbi:MAG: fused MFS/spermidine synthase [Bacteroidota bacterium]